MSYLIGEFRFSFLTIIIRFSNLLFFFCCQFIRSINIVLLNTINFFFGFTIKALKISLIRACSCQIILGLLKICLGLLELLIRS